MERELKKLNHAELKDLVPEKTDIAVVPIGTVEAHGITPLGTDIIIPEVMAERLAEDVNAIIAPVIPYGITRSLVGHPGTVAIRREVFEAYCSDVFDALVDAGFRRIIALNGHGGQIDELKEALFDLSRARRVKSLLINWWIETDEIRKATLEREGGHAGSDETAAIVAIDASLAKGELYEDWMTTRYSSAYSAYPFPGSIISYSDGDASLVLDEEKCKAYFDAVTDRVGEIIKTVLTKWDKM
jgi:creatinine amidohydrolase